MKWFIHGQFGQQNSFLRKTQYNFVSLICQNWSKGFLLEIKCYQFYETILFYISPATFTWVLHLLWGWINSFFCKPCISNDILCSKQNMYRQKFWACNTSVSLVYGWKGLVSSCSRLDINWSLFWGCLQGRRFWGLWVWPGLNLITLQLPKEGR